MNDTNSMISERLALAASRLQKERTGHEPRSVTIVLSEDTLVVTLHDALTPAEKALASNSDGAAQVQEFHRQLFAHSNDTIWQEIERITGRSVLESTAEIVTKTGAVVHAFTTGTMVHVFLLGSEVLSDKEQVERAEDDGLNVISAGGTAGPVEP